MRLAIVTAYPPSKVTLNEYAYHLIKHFRQKEEITELILLTDATKEAKTIDFTEKGCKITVKECWSFNSYTNVFNVSKVITQTKPDSILFNLQFMKFGDKKIPAALGLLLPLVCKIKRIPSVVLLHNILEQVDLKSAGFTSNKVLQILYGLMGSILTRIILKADIVAVTMKKYVGVLEQKYKAKNIVAIPHGTFEVSKEKPRFILPKGPLKIMTFGKFGTYKKVGLLIEAVQKVRKSTGMDLEIVIAGTDNPNVPGYLENVKRRFAYVPKLSFTGYVEESEIPILFNESAVVVFPYTSTTGSSGVLHQAGSYGKAVIMPDLGDLALLVEEEGYQAEFFKPSCVRSLAKSIEEIVTNEAYRIALGKANYRAAIAYPMSKITDIYLETFHAIASKKKYKSSITYQVN
jgi:glycosyltransferase involved in cell wall biosynthesis